MPAPEQGAPSSSSSSSVHPLELGATVACTRAGVAGASSVEIIERRFRRAAIWCAVAAALCLTGLIHSYRWTPGDTALSLTPAWEFAAAYGILAALLAGSTLIV